FGVAADRGAVVPAQGSGIDAGRGTLPPAVPEFNPLAFSLEHALPFVDLQQRRWWTVVAAPAMPWSVAARAVAALETAFGWLACLLALACVVVPLSRGRVLTPS
ncbi:MAG TPA: hypothetical protein VLE45_15425, partial [Burkholderiaceae bacterium]|nr:hypothetical protein [Burkholderiaceae bacterium]